MGARRESLYGMKAWNSFIMEEAWSELLIDY
jgi:hypothetical protein